MPSVSRVTAAFGAVACATAAALIGIATTAGPATAGPAAGVEPKVPVPVCCGNARLVPGQSLTPGLDHATLDATTLPQTTAGAPYVYGQTEVGLRLVLQGDGNLVEYLDAPGSSTVAVWSTRTTTGVSLTFQSDHNVVLRDAEGRALWATGTAGSDAAYFDVYGNGQIVTQDRTGRVLSATGPSLTGLPGILIQGAASVGRTFTVAVQSDGNLVEYDTRDRAHPRAVWDSHTSGVGPVRLVAQLDGNLVLRQIATGRAVWSSRTQGPTGYYQFDVQDDGNVVLYRTDGVHRIQAVWATGVRR